MHARQRENSLCEVRSLIVLVATEEWLKARDVASMTGHPWRKVAFALRRLARNGYVEAKTIAYRGKHRSREYTTAYRAPNAKPSQSFIEKYCSGMDI